MKNNLRYFGFLSVDPRFHVELELLLTGVKLHVFALNVENLEKFRVRNEKEYF